MPQRSQGAGRLFALWDYWSRAMRGNEYMGIFPGDPGGCCRNGCTAETFVDLCLELSKVVRKNNPGVKIEVATWGEPFAGWGVPLWTGDRRRANDAFPVEAARVPARHVCQHQPGFQPRLQPARTAATAAVRPGGRQDPPRAHLGLQRYRGRGHGLAALPGAPHVPTAPRGIEQGCYSGGICYTMAPKLNCLSIFCCAEAYWNPPSSPRACWPTLADLSGPERAAIGPLLEEFEVIPDWGYYAPFPYHPGG